MQTKSVSWMFSSQILCFGDDLVLRLLLFSSRIQDDRDSLPLAVGAPSVSSQLLPSVLDATATKKVEGDPFTSMDSTKIIPAATA